MLAEWQKPIPRLLIFDNCEEPELLTRWRPHARRLPRAGHQPPRAIGSALGIPTLATGRAAAAESMALLREYQPDAEGAMLDAIADELGDLPLALHLAGSYLARYRHTTDAAGYLASLRQASPLAHESLQERRALAHRARPACGAHVRLQLRSARTRRPDCRPGAQLDALCGLPRPRRADSRIAGAAGAGSRSMRMRPISYGWGFSWAARSTS